MVSLWCSHTCNLQIRFLHSSIQVLVQLWGVFSFLPASSWWVKTWKSAFYNNVLCFGWVIRFYNKPKCFIFIICLRKSSAFLCFKPIYNSVHRKDTQNIKKSNVSPHEHKRFLKREKYWMKFISHLGKYLLQNCCKLQKFLSLRSSVHKDEWNVFVPIKVSPHCYGFRYCLPHLSLP